MIARRLCTGFLAACLVSPAGLTAQTTRPAGLEDRPILKQFDRDGDGKLSPAERQEARRAIEEQLRRELPNRSVSRPIEIPPGVKVVRDVEYARVGDRSLTLDIYAPEKADRPVPVVMWIHGGGWRQGSKERCPAVFLAAEGFAVVSISYRLSQEAEFPAQIEDCKGAVRWIRARAKEYNFDRERVGVWGASAGGHLAALLGTTGGMKAVEGEVGGNLDESSRVQAVCDFFGPATLEAAAFAGTAGEKSPAGLDMVRQLLGGTPEDRPQLARLASPLAHVTRDDPPFLIVHGSRDSLVPLRQSELLTAALRRAGVEVTLHVVKDAGHGMGVRTAEVDGMVAAFFSKHLKPAASAPATKPAQTVPRKRPEAKKARKAA